MGASVECPVVRPAAAGRGGSFRRFREGETPAGTAAPSTNPTPAVSPVFLTVASPFPTSDISVKREEMWDVCSEEAGGGWSGVGRRFRNLSRVHRELPEITSVERMPAKRKGKVYIDFLQNGFLKTLAAPYSLRPVSYAGVSTPLRWEEVKRGLDLRQWTYNTIQERLGKMGNPWEDLDDCEVDIGKLLGVGAKPPALLPEGMTKTPSGRPEWSYSFYAAASWAAGKKEYVRDFRQETGMDITGIVDERTPVHKLIETISGKERETLVAWLDWVAEYVYGLED